MSNIADKDLVCTECKGEGEVACDCGCCNCEGMIHCDTCDGTGVSEEFVDIPRWQEAVKTLAHYLGYKPCRIVARSARGCGAFIGMGAYGGRKHVIKIKDFLLPEAAERYITSE